MAEKKPEINYAGDFGKVMSAYAAYNSLNSGEEEYRNKVKNSKELEGILKEDTGEDIKLVNEDSEDFKKAKAYEGLYKVKKEKTAKFMRDGLSSILASADPEALVESAAVSVKHDAKNEQYPVAKIFAEYITIQKATTQPGEKSGITEEEHAEYQQKLFKLLPSLIAKRLKKNKKDISDKEAKATAEALVFISGGSGYTNTVVKDSIEEMRNELISRKSEVISYLASALTKDDDLIQFGTALYRISEIVKQNKEKEKKDKEKKKK